MTLAQRRSDQSLEQFAYADSRALYDLLIAPLEPALKAAGIETLVIQPQGRLRLVSFPALWTGEGFLVHRYRLPMALGSTLFDPETGDLADRRLQRKVLLAALSEPGENIQQMPEIAELVARETRGVRGGTARSGRVDVTAAAVNTMLLRMSLALPGVKSEVEQIGQLASSTRMLNEEFTAERFLRQVEMQSPSVIHIASHAFLGSTADESFILTHDGVIDSQGLRRALASVDEFRQPVELLVLSACRTAVGDDRFPLGLTGLALQMRAKSVMGSLWPLSDAAAQRLFPVFYRHLIVDKVSRSEALRRAQIELSKDPQFAHPFYWASVVLIGNWL